MKLSGKYILILLVSSCLLPATLSAAQISGFVTGSTGDALPFATIYIKETGFGTTTNLEGKYEFNMDPGEYTLIFQYLGYKTASREITVGEENITIDIRLEEQSYVLPDLTYMSGEDPAYAIMRKVIAKSKYHLYQLQEYSTRVYVKGSGRVVKVPFLFRKRLEKEGIDSTRVFTVESISELNYQYPNIYAEKVLSINTNIEDESPSPMPFVKTSFYEPRVVEAMSPLAPNAFAHYRYRYEGAFDDDGYTVFKIYVKPRIKGDQVFEGYLYILEDLWAIHSLNFETYLQGFKVKIDQIYRPVLPQVWMPVTLKFDASGSFMGFTFEFNYAAVSNQYEVTLNEEFIKGFEADSQFEVKSEDKADVGRDTVKLTVFQQDMSKKEMRRQIRAYEKEANRTGGEQQDVVLDESVEIDSMAYQKDSTYWVNVRPIPLTELEVENYKAKDSLIVERKKQEAKDSVRHERNKKFRIEHTIVGNNYRLSETSTLIWHPLWNKLSYNTVEGLNIHANLDYRLKLDDEKTILVGTNIRYGFSSKQWNALGFSRYGFKRHQHDGFLKITGGRYISQINTNNPIPYWWNMMYTLFLRENYMKLFERDFVDLEFQFPVLSKLVSGIVISHSEKRALENTSDFSFFNKDSEFSPNNPVNVILEETQFDSYNIFTSGLYFDFMPFLKYTISDGQKRIIEGSSPVFSIGYKYGNAYKGSNTYQYNYLHGKINYGRQFGVGNRYDVSFAAGKVFTDAVMDFPEFLHFMGNQTILVTGNLFESYRMLPYYSYSTNNYYVEVHGYYQFRRLLLTQLTYARIAGLREDLYINYLYANTLDHYYELGYAIDNIFRFLRLEVVGQFMGSNYQGLGFRIAIAKNLSLE